MEATKTKTKKALISLSSHYWIPLGNIGIHVATQMEKKKVVEALARVSTLSQGVIESEKNSNNLLDLIEYLNVS